MADYGLHISTQDGLPNLLEPKEQFFTVYGKEGHQITKRNGNVWELNGFIIAAGLVDFMDKITALNAVFAGFGTRSVELADGPFDCYVEDGSTVSKVYIFGNAAYAHYNIKLRIV
jgi:hypothetical protein